MERFAFNIIVPIPIHKIAFSKTIKLKQVQQCIYICNQTTPIHLIASLTIIGWMIMEGLLAYYKILNIQTHTIASFKIIMRKNKQAQFVFRNLTT